MKKYIIIKADTNDADYIQEKHEITNEQLIEIMPVIKAIKDYTEDKSINHQKMNYWTISRRHPSPEELYVNTGKCTEESFRLFDELIPYCEDGIHTIESIEILEVVNEIKLL